ncbi:MAG TPA: hypothetical protein VF959_00260 [Casimicrobiaceae bacterium]
MTCGGLAGAFWAAAGSANAKAIAALKRAMDFIIDNSLREWMFATPRTAQGKLNFIIRPRTGAQDREASGESEHGADAAAPIR